MRCSCPMRRVGALAAGLVPAMVATWAAERAIPEQQIAATRAAASPLRGCRSRLEFVI